MIDLFSLLIRWPFVALAPAFALWMLARRRRSRVVQAAALAWLLYFVYEQGIRAGVLCSSDCNIRADLLLIYPLLGLLTMAALVAYLRAGRSPPADRE